MSEIRGFAVRARNVGMTFDDFNRLVMKHGFFPVDNAYNRLKKYGQLGRGKESRRLFEQSVLIERGKHEQKNKEMGL